MEDERRDTFLYLVERFGASEDEAERLLDRDADLWVSPAEMRLGVPDKEAVEQLQQAVYEFDDLVAVSSHMSEAAHLLAMDAQERAYILLRRAKERLREAG